MNIYELNSIGSIYIKQLRELEIILEIKNHSTFNKSFSKTDIIGRKK